MTELDRIFNAKSVAVVGASANPEKRGHIILKNIIEGGFEGRIYPVNPGAKEILGLKSYSTVNDIPESPDLVVISVPATSVPGVILGLKEKKVGGAVIISGGFREAGNFELEHELAIAIRESGIRVIGPNCQGINFTPNKLCASWPLIKKRGALAVISQSGTVGATLSEWAEDEGVGISGFVSLGNRVDVDETELLKFFSSDQNTRSIALYLEGVKNGRNFMAVLREVCQQKPVVILKGGRTEKGKEAAQSHTKSVAGNDAVFDAVCRQCGAIKAETITDLYDVAKAGAMLSRTVKSLFIITSSGGSGILATDYAEYYKINVPKPSQKALDLLSDSLPKHCIIGNPLDLTGDTDAFRYGVAASIASQAEIAEDFLLIFGDPIPHATAVCQELARKIPQQIIAVYLGGGEIGKEETKKLLSMGIATFPTPERAVIALSKLIRQEDGNEYDHQQ